MGPALQMGLLHYMEQEEPWPNADRMRYTVSEPEKPVGHLKITDLYLQMVTYIKVSALENPRFDLLNAYAKGTRKYLDPCSFELWEDLDSELQFLFGRHK